MEQFTIFGKEYITPTYAIPIKEAERINTYFHSPEAVEVASTITALARPYGRIRYIDYPETNAPSATEFLKGCAETYPLNYGSDYAKVVIRWKNKTIAVMSNHDVCYFRSSEINDMIYLTVLLRNTYPELPLIGWLTLMGEGRSLVSFNPHVRVCGLSTINYLTTYRANIPTAALIQLTEDVHTYPELCNALVEEQMLKAGDVCEPLVWTKWFFEIVGHTDREGLVGWKEWRADVARVEALALEIVDKGKMTFNTAMRTLEQTSTDDDTSHVVIDTGRRTAELRERIRVRVQHIERIGDSIDAINVGDQPFVITGYAAAYLHGVTIDFDRVDIRVGDRELVEGRLGVDIPEVGFISEFKEVCIHQPVEPHKTFPVYATYLQHMIMYQKVILHDLPVMGIEELLAFFARSTDPVDVQVTKELSVRMMKRYSEQYLHKWH